MLLLYLGIFRPVEILMATDLFPKKSSNEMQAYVFSDPFRHTKSLVWSPWSIERRLKLGNGLKMTAQANRLVYSAIIQKQFGHLLQKVDQGTVLNLQSQHSPKTAIRQYAVEQLQKITGIQYTAYEKQMTMAQAMHAFCRLVKPIQESITAASEVPRLMVSDIYSHEHHGLFLARQLILQKYQLASLPAESVAVKSRYLYWKTPFLYCENTPESKVFGDDILIHLVLELYRGPGVSQGRPSDNHVIYFTAGSATLVRPYLFGSNHAKFKSFRLLPPFLSGLQESTHLTLAI
jgi:hypothetical protein